MIKWMSTSISLSRMSWWRQGFISLNSQTSLLSLQQWMVRTTFLTSWFWCQVIVPCILSMVRRAHRMCIVPFESLNVLFFWVGSLKGSGSKINIIFHAPSSIHEGLWILLRIIWVHPHAGFPFPCVIKIGSVWHIIFIPAAELWDMGPLLWKKIMGKKGEMLSKFLISISLRPWTNVCKYLETTI